MTVAIVSKELYSPRTFSISFITFAGLKKCVPQTFSGLDVDTAISFISNDEVLQARDYLGQQYLIIGYK
jgi:hypothetical protein